MLIKVLLSAALFASGVVVHAGNSAGFDTSQSRWVAWRKPVDWVCCCGSETQTDCPNGLAAKDEIHGLQAIGSTEKAWKKDVDGTCRCCIKRNRLCVANNDAATNSCTNCCVNTPRASEQVPSTKCN